MAPLYEYRLQVAGHATRALETTGTGPGIVLLHGWGDSADAWRRLLGELALHGRRAIAVDLPGFGAATRLGPGPMLPQLDAFVAELILTWAGEDRVVLAGSSLGGSVALRVAEHGDALPLAGVVPVASAGGDPAGWWFDPIEHDPLVRRLLALPVAVPRALVSREPGGDPRAAQRAVADMLAVRHVAPELFGPPFDAGASECPIVMGIEGGGRLLELLLQFPGP